MKSFQQTREANVTIKVMSRYVFLLFRSLQLVMLRYCKSSRSTSCNSIGPSPCPGPEFSAPPRENAKCTLMSSRTNLEFVRRHSLQVTHPMIRLGTCTQYLLRLRRDIIPGFGDQVRSVIPVVPVQLAMDPDLDPGLFGIQLSDTEDDTSPAEGDPPKTNAAEPPSTRTGQSEAEFQAVRREYRVKVENGEVCIHRDSTYTRVYLPPLSGTSATCQPASLPKQNQKKSTHHSPSQFVF